jgi:hypothetical protein
MLITCGEKIGFGIEKITRWLLQAKDVARAVAMELALYTLLFV